MKTKGQKKTCTFKYTYTARKIHQELEFTFLISKTRKPSPRVVKTICPDHTGTARTWWKTLLTCYFRQCYSHHSWGEAKGFWEVPSGAHEEQGGEGCSNMVLLIFPVLYVEILLRFIWSKEPLFFLWVLFKASPAINIVELCAMWHSHKHKRKNVLCPQQIKL